MADAKKVCRVCGKQYAACRTKTTNPAIFRWQDVACSPECGAEYLRRVIASRTPEPQEEKPRKFEQRRKREPDIVEQPIDVEQNANDETIVKTVVETETFEM